MINRYNNKFFIFFAFLEDSGEVDRQKADSGCWDPEKKDCCTGTIVQRN